MYKENMQGGTKLVSLIHFHVPATTTKTTIVYILNSHGAHAHKMTQRKHYFRQKASIYST